MISFSRSWWTSTWSTRSLCEEAAGPPAAPKGRPVSAACSAASSAWGTCVWLSRLSLPRECGANWKKERTSWCRDMSPQWTRDWSNHSGGRKGQPGKDTSRPPEVRGHPGLLTVLLFSFYLLKYSVCHFQQNFFFFFK